MLSKRCDQCNAPEGRNNGFIINGLCAPCWSESLLVDPEAETITVEVYSAEIAHLSIKETSE